MPTVATDEEMLFEQWLGTYRPIANLHPTANGACEGLMFETYGAELQQVNAAASNLIWTVVQGDGGLWVSPGYHHVNRIGYFICEVGFGESTLPADVPYDLDRATVELRAHLETGVEEWCVIWQGDVYPFGSDNLGKECAEREASRFEAGKDDGFIPSEFF